MRRENQSLQMRKREKGQGREKSYLPVVEVVGSSYLRQYISFTKFGNLFPSNSFSKPLISARPAATYAITKLMALCGNFPSPVASTQLALAQKTDGAQK